MRRRIPESGGNGNLLATDSQGAGCACFSVTLGQLAIGAACASPGALTWIRSGFSGATNTESIAARGSRQSR